MGSHCTERSALLPKGWTKHVKSALIQAVSLAATAVPPENSILELRDA